MADDSQRWKEIEHLLDRVLDLREATERARDAKLARLLARNTAPRGGSTPSDSTATPPPKPRRGGHTH